MTTLPVIDYHDGETELGTIEVRPGTHAAVGHHEMLIRQHDHPESLFAVVLDDELRRALAEALLNP